MDSCRIWVVLELHSGVQWFIVCAEVIGDFILCVYVCVYEKVFHSLLLIFKGYITSLHWLLD